MQPPVPQVVVPLGQLQLRAALAVCFRMSQVMSYLIDPVNSSLCRSGQSACPGALNGSQPGDVLIQPVLLGPVMGGPTRQVVLEFKNL